MPNVHQTVIERAFDIDIVLETNMGQLSVLKHRCLIWNDMTDDILLGNDLLIKLGIDPKRALDTLMVFSKADNSDSAIELAQVSPDIGQDIQSELQTCLEDKVNDVRNQLGRDLWK